MMHLIAGPCSVESPEQLRVVVTELNTSHLSPLTSHLWIRGGVWKPRTRPGGFEGRGEAALRWMRELKREFPEVRFCTEVATPEHVELCLKHGIDGLWLGSRTTGNPFSVGELCQALRGAQLPVWVKNPMTPDLKLWLGAIERVQKAGIKEVAAIHRGFTPYPVPRVPVTPTGFGHPALHSDVSYRNDPMWEVPIELRRILPDIPLLCDPSHIGGRRELLPTLMQTALDLHFDGLMVEVHPAPDEALTDAPQQVTPQEFLRLIAALKPRQEGNPTELTLLRQQIDQVDAQLVELLATRLNISRKIAQVKSDNNLAVYQPKRWEEVLAQKLRQAQSIGLDPQFIKEIYDRIHAESVRVQLQK